MCQATAHIQRPGGLKQQKQHSGPSGQCPLRLTPVMGRRCRTEVGSCGLAAAIIKDKRKRRCEIHFPRPITVEVGRGSWDTLDNTRQLSTSAYKKPVPGAHRSGAPLPATAHYGDGTLRSRQPSHRGDTHLLRESGAFFMAKGTLLHRDPGNPSSVGKRKQKLVL